MAYLGNFPAFGIIGTPNIQDFAVTPAKLSTGAPYWASNGNFGVGTSSPAEKLTVAATANTAAKFTSTATTTALSLDNTNANGWGSNIAINTGGVAAGFFGTIGSLIGSTVQDLAVWATAGNGFRVYTNGNNLRATFDNSGNLGLGVTPSAWFSGYKVLQIGDSGSLFSLNTNAGIAVNAIDDGAWKYRATGFAGRSYFSVSNGSHVWVNAPSGTAGNAISFTQAMTLDASGKLRLGVYRDGGNGVLQVNGDSGITIASGTGDVNSNGLGRIRAIAGSPYPGGLAFDYYAYNGSTYQFYEGIRLDPSGNLLVGTTASSAAKVVAIGSGNISGIYGEAQSGTTSGLYGMYGKSIITSTYASGGVIGMSINNNTYGILGYWTGSAYWSLYGNGSTYVSGTYQGSDARLKENIEPLSGSLAKLMALSPVEFDWKQNSDQAKNGLGHDCGLIAQDVLPILPGIVKEIDAPETASGNDPTLNEELGKFYTIEYSRLIPHLISAIQELKAEVDALKEAA